MPTGAAAICSGVADSCNACLVDDTWGDGRRLTTLELLTNVLLLLLLLLLGMLVLLSPSGAESTQCWHWLLALLLVLSLLLIVATSGMLATSCCPLTVV